ncbi:CPBP family intramembrane glutamic endopeptidase [Metasolibacillus sp.]|uniref:CPBP family intramembrane glutamic endopeptidase n=1 Tax=Metasolibacillus sp. TaxID=2703680 RepID=UPI0025F543CF|nr:CPBP family intramembrane glutamic endopeptidase [Metasolibacillus sp.]MCT6925092.1 CPBP family intramembrane metalloprotease [Metasolibacillus sp.]MCT6941296.1 CPBP family intramembrane metalloprotease [Metasolibacillus sp.]
MHVTSIQSPKFKTQKTAFYILLLYVASQFSTFLLLIPPVNDFFFQLVANAEYPSYTLMAWWNTVAWILVIIISVILIARHQQFFNVFPGKPVSIPISIMWGVIGFFLVLFGQGIAAQIEILLLGIEPGSENTAKIMEITRAAPIMIVSSVILAPILEELIFRRVIFGSLIQKQNFWVSAFISALLFGIVHMELTHIILYTSMGLIFSFLYYKTKRLMTSIIAHMLLNGFVTILQLNIDKIAPLVDAVPK